MNVCRLKLGAPDSSERWIKGLVSGPAQKHTDGSAVKEQLLTLTMRSLPQVTIRPLDGSKSMWAMLCFPSWNVASAVRLHHTNTVPEVHHGVCSKNKQFNEVTEGV